jgi:hypothetical protein
LVREAEPLRVFRYRQQFGVTNAWSAFSARDFYNVLYDHGPLTLTLSPDGEREMHATLFSMW